ncbi:Response regulator receiver domain-containing protein [Geoalkalibacter ferrihydriticus]|uniref:Response regulatory domain-containing protein n=2 Tax=Geoalkalibacter ferrihydriticus TaxID=392333 RepID=A0A0C2DWC2_9BACT|nr:response regulator [Geoalkalibacter ferrihydriticus]KIH77739.1 hypothetical protein GFER_03545 [Geoalkalibacter ferrihydriticus DSM 17813]SDL76526.1 Response regulator receiver domain-containing protein [Geoalkalibacter ferrihydriticus]
MKEPEKNAMVCNIVDWLRGVEERAALFYAEAAAAFAEDLEFSAFLSRLAKEEDDHFKLLNQAATQITQGAIADSCFWVDENLQQNAEAPFVRGRSLLKDNQLSKAALIGIIAEAEFSEWNDIFLYAIGTLRKCGREYQEAAAELDRHRLELEQFILSSPGGEALLAKTGRMHPVWTKCILIVEDEPAVANLIKALVSSHAEVVLAKDGAEGIARIRERYFDVIVSDVEMPKINGIDMYQQALTIDANLNKHFVFFTGTRKPQHHRFFQSENVIMLPKPTSLDRLRKAIKEVAESARPGTLN